MQHNEETGSDRSPETVPPAGRRWAGWVAVLATLVGALPALAVAVAARAAGPCDPPILNPIVCENSLPGAAPASWQITADGDPGIQGFATDISVNLGGTIGFKVNTNSNNYQLAIYRMGYYQGNGARLITTISPSASLPQKQPACLADTTVGLVDCGNWAPSASWAVPANAVTGVYFAKLNRLDKAGSSWITFVVRDDSSTSDLLFQTSDTTWQAYNSYGGWSLYTAPASSTVGRAYKVSYNRPFNTAAVKPESWLLNAEQPMIRWLEANGYNVSYSSGVDSDRRGTLLKNHRVFLSAGHDEYWSGGQRANVEAARDSGVNLAFFSGNEVFWKTRWEASKDGTSTPNRTLVTYKETHAGAVIDPADPPTWTGTWRDPRFSPPADGGRPENRLTGTIFMVNGPTYVAMTVPAADGRLRFWRNTAVSRQSAGQTLTIDAGCGCFIGYEWDSDMDNGSRPAGLMDLSHTTSSVPQLLVDYGSTYAPGQASHSLTLYRAPSGALVFGAGTVDWAYGLDGSSSVNSSIPDLNIQQATVNLFADMGVQPGTLQTGLIAASKSTNVTPPTSSITPPTSGTAPTAGTPFTLTGTAAAAAGAVVGGVEVSVDGGTTWHPARGRESWSYAWVPAAAGTVTIKSRAVDDSGNIESPGPGLTVQVSPRPCPCSLWPATATPANAGSSDTQAVEVGVKLSSDAGGSISGIRYYKSSTNTGTHVGNLWSSTGTLLASATFTGETASGWQQVNFPTPVPVTAGTQYVASYHTNTGGYAADQAFFSVNGVDNAPLHAPASGNGVYAYGSASAFPSSTFNATNYWVDVVLTTAGTGPIVPQVVAQSPTPNATGVSLSTTVSATFNEAVTPSSIKFTLADGTGAAVAGTTSYASSSNVATFTPSAALAQATTYTANVSGATDSSGSVMSPVSWSFKTLACPCSLFAPTATPSVANSGDTNSVELGLKFTSDSAGSITGLRFYKGSANTGTHVGSLWSSGGTLLSSVTFTSETASGWQQATLPAPISINANTTYIVSYHTSGNYSKDVNYFATQVDNSPLHGLANSTPGGNGVYAYSTKTTFPTSTFSATNYWVDAVFQPAGTSSVPTVISQFPVPNATLVAPTTAVTATFNKPVTASSIVFGLKDGSGAAVGGTTTWDGTSNTATFKPTASLAQGVTFTATVSGATDSAGAVMTPVSWPFSTYACPCSLFPATATPALISSGDASAVELGLKFKSDAAGSVTGVRFYKATNNTGTHTGHLWSASGTLLTSVTFANETASGWQTATFSTPVSISANTIFVVSYHTDAGNYSKDQSFFATSGYDANPLHAPSDAAAGGNGVYVYGASAFPTNTYFATNYWVDVVFTTP